MSPQVGPPSGLAAAVESFNEAAAQLDAARRALHREMAADAATSPLRRTDPPCGHPSAYRGHRRRGEPVDPACAEAWSWTEARRRNRRRSA